MFEANPGRYPSLGLRSRISDLQEGLCPSAVERRILAKQGQSAWSSAFIKSGRSSPWRKRMCAVPVRCRYPERNYLGAGRVCGDAGDGSRARFCLLIWYSFATCLETAATNSLDVSRFTTVLFIFAILAQSLTVLLLLECVTAIFRFCRASGAAGPSRPRHPESN